MVSSRVTATVAILGSHRLGHVLSTPPSQPPSPPPTQITGQQAEPSTQVPPAPLYTPSPVATQTNNLAVVSLVVGVLSFLAHIVPVVGGLAMAIVAIVTGTMARRQIRQTGEQGMWMATAGLVIGIIHLALLGLLVLALILLVFVLGGIALLGGTHSAR